MISFWKWWNSPGVKKTWKDKPSALRSLSVTNLTFHTSEAWTESNLFPSPAWKDTIINQLSNRGWGHAQAIKKVTAHPAWWRAEASPADGYSPSQKYKCRNYVTIRSKISKNQWICVICASRNHHKNKNQFFGKCGNHYCGSQRQLFNEFTVCLRGEEKPDLIPVEFHIITYTVKKSQFDFLCIFVNKKS